ncbi:MAG: sigma factor, partial [Planctomycetota bacterium]
MTRPSQILSPQFLAEHQHFVQRLARGLARDEAAALDLAQETWLATLASGSQAIVRPRAWLAAAMRRRASNLARSESVRREHETRSARDEANEDAGLQERVSFQHSIVAEVLQLDEPYRSVVLLRYFQ